ncbi:hypothetical protein KKE74_02990 [Patescibacteria group bacterium]|nr:hypothetical protein [Patescibacteria group bacterium]
MKIIKNILLVFLVLILSYFSSIYFGNLYKNISHDYGTWIDLSSLVGIHYGYVFFLLFIFTAFGGLKKYWWIGFLLIPTVIFEVYFDWRFQYVYIPIAIGLIGWVIGFIISKIVVKLKVMPD